MPQRNWLITGVSSGFGRIITYQDAFTRFRTTTS